MRHLASARHRRIPPDLAWIRRSLQRITGATIKRWPTPNRWRRKPRRDGVERHLLSDAHPRLAFSRSNCRGFDHTVRAGAAATDPPAKPSIGPHGFGLIHPWIMRFGQEPSGRGCATSIRSGDRCVVPMLGNLAQFQAGCPRLRSRSPSIRPIDPTRGSMPQSASAATRVVAEALRIISRQLDAAVVDQVE